VDAYRGPRHPAFLKETRMRLMTMCSAMVIALTVRVGQAVADALRSGTPARSDPDQR